MAQGTKITFSEAEFEAITHPDFFYTKHAAIQKVMELLGETERTLRQIVLAQPQLGLHTNIESPKIFRGENYKQLPYVVLDYPRRFSTDSVFAFRSMFWWGKEFSFTLHIQSAAYEHFKKNISEHIDQLRGKDFHLCVNKSPWQYYFEEDNYLPLDKMIEEGNALKEVQSKDFIKLSRKIPVMDFDRVPEHAAETLSMLLKILF